MQYENWVKLYPMVVLIMAINLTVDYRPATWYSVFIFFCLWSYINKKIARKIARSESFLSGKVSLNINRFNKIYD